jgi:glyoxylase-like metal-dependent hydrolase (beta-lactamase superfamily II)
VENIIVLDIKYTFGDTEGIIHPVVLRDANDMVLVDCGYPGFMPFIEDAFKLKNLDCSRLTTIIVTHHDHDHMGALAEFKHTYPQIKIVASETEAAYIAGEKKSLRLEQAEALQDTLSEEEKPLGAAFCETLRSVQPVKADMLVRDGDVLDLCGGCEIVGTPGHTPGHISLYLKNHRTLITGDAAVLENGRPVIANPQYALDLENARKSLSRILGFNAETYICYHGGLYKRYKNLP